MDLTIINRRGHPISGQELAQVLLDGVPVPSVPGPEPVLQRLQQLAHKAWRSEISCPPELFWVEDRAEFVRKFIALHI